MSVKEHSSFPLHLGSVSYDYSRDMLRDAAGETVFLRHQSQKVLRLLVEHLGEVVSKDQVMEHVWHGVAVTDDSLTQCISDIRRAIGDGKKKVVKTIPKQGYFLNASVLDRPVELTAVEPAELLENRAAPIIATQAANAQRRNLTVLSCEVVEYSALSIRLDPELLSSVQQACSDCFVAMIQRRLGTLARAEADDMVAYFGLEEATDFDSERAVETAFELIEVFPQLASDLNFPLTIRIGISTGLVVTTSTGAHHGGSRLSVAGAAPVLATHLRNVASAGEVIIGQETQSLLRELYTYRDLGDVDVPGQVEPISRIQVTGRNQTKSRFQALRSPKRLLIAREDDMNLLSRRWARARIGDGGTVLISGEAGIGKSRMVNELIGSPDTSSFYALRFLGSPNRQDSALFLVAEGLRATLGFNNHKDTEQNCEKIEEILRRSASEINSGDLYRWQRGTDVSKQAAIIAEFLGIQTADRYDPIVFGPEKRREMLLEALVSVIEGLAMVRPVMVLCEDMHWFDASSIELVDMLVDRLPIRSILLIVTFRSEFEAPWRGQPQVTSISLNRLTAKRSAELVHQVTNGIPLPSELVDQICDRADGVPLFLEELTASILESGIVARDGDRYVATKSSEERSIPATLQQALLARFDRALSNRTIAQTAAALGRRFSYALINAVLDDGPDDLDAGLDQLVRAGLLLQRGTRPVADFSFKHALVQEIAYNSANAAERVSLHAVIAERLHAAFPQLQAEEPELLAHHYTKAQNPATALPLWVAAGFAAAGQTAHTEAVGHFTTGLAILDNLPADPQLAPLRLQFLMGLVRSLGASSGYSTPEVGATIAEARAISSDLGPTPETFLLFHGMTQFLLIGGDLDGAFNMASKCLEISKLTKDPAQRSESEALVGYLLFAKGEMDRSMNHLKLAEDIYIANDGSSFAPLNTHDTLNHTLVTQLNILLALGRNEEFESVLERCATHVHALQRPYDLAFNHAAQAFFGLLRGKAAQAFPHAEQSLRLCQIHGFPLYEMVSTQLRAHALGHMGRAQETVETACSAVPIFQSMGMNHFAGFYLGEAAALLDRVGRNEEALTMIDQAITTTDRLKELYFLSLLWRRKGDILARAISIDRKAVIAAFETAEKIAIGQGAVGFAKEARAAIQAFARIADGSSNQSG